MTLANLMKCFSKSQFSVTHVNGNRVGINKLNPQSVTIKESTLTIDNGNKYDLNKNDLSSYLSNTKFGRYNFIEKDLFLNFCKHIHYATNHWDKKSDRRKLILF